MAGALLWTAQAGWPPPRRERQRRRERRWLRGGQCRISGLEMVLIGLYCAGYCEPSRPSRSVRFSAYTDRARQFETAQISRLICRIQRAYLAVRAQVKYKLGRPGMNATSRWKAWLDSAKPEAAERVANRIAERTGLSPLDLKVAPYRKGGFVADWLVAHGDRNREALIVELIRSGQRVASGWTMTGSVDDDFGALVSKAGEGHISVAGAVMLTWEILNGP